MWNCKCKYERKKRETYCFPFHWPTFAWSASLEHVRPVLGRMHVLIHLKLFLGAWSRFRESSWIFGDHIETVIFVSLGERQTQLS